METMPTNDVFHHLLNILQLRDKDEILDMFHSQGVEASKSKIKAWATKSGRYRPDYREMPRSALDAFIAELYERKLIE